ncbi:MAG: hypothetical protein VKJ64_14465, partial [Leptolyngbyaceae bacterium]|nr:hypothetical protein [Leptolyngbyaceae bacterium]
PIPLIAIAPLVGTWWPTAILNLSPVIGSTESVLRQYQYGGSKLAVLNMVGCQNDFHLILNPL